jgi:hypothetical protein
MTDIHSTRIPSFRCPECGYSIDTAGTLDPRGPKVVRPRPGDISVCINCGDVAVFDEALKRRPSTLAERSAAGPDLERVVSFIALRGPIPQGKTRK